MITYLKNIDINKQSLNRTLLIGFIAIMLILFMFSLVKIMSGNVDYLSNLMFSGGVLALYLLQQNYNVTLPSLNRDKIKTNITRIKQLSDWVRENYDNILSLTAIAKGNSQQIMLMNERLSGLEKSNKELQNRLKTLEVVDKAPH